MFYLDMIILLVIFLVIKIVMQIAWVDLTLILRETYFSTTGNRVLMELEHAPLTSNEVTYFADCDPSLSKVYNYANHGGPYIMKEQLKPFFRCRDELSCEN